MSKSLRFQSVFNIIVADGPKTFIHQLAITPPDNEIEDKVRAYYERIVILPCADSSVVDPCHGTPRHSITVHHFPDSVDLDKYKSIVVPGFYRLILDFNVEEIRKKYAPFKLEATIPLHETGTEKETDEESELENVLDALMLANTPDDDNNTELFAIEQEYVPPGQETKT